MLILIKRLKRKKTNHTLPKLVSKENENDWASQVRSFVFWCPGASKPCCVTPPPCCKPSRVFRMEYNRRRRLHSTALSLDAVGTLTRKPEMEYDFTVGSNLQSIEGIQENLRVTSERLRVYGGRSKVYGARSRVSGLELKLSGLQSRVSGP